MNKILILIGLSLLFFVSCSDKRYEDYKEDDFFKVQGVVTKVESNSNPFDASNLKNIEYYYFLDENHYLIGHDNDISTVKRIGRTIVVLVYKKDKTISFYGYNDVINLELLKKGYEIVLEKNPDFTIKN